MTSEIVPLFATPVRDLGPARCGSAQRAISPRSIAERDESHPGTQHSNLGGWQSTWDMDRWGGASAIKLLAIGRNLANRFTTDREGKPACRDLARQHVGQHQPQRATATSSIPIPAASGRASTTSTTAASPPIRRWAASWNSWIRAGRGRRCTRRSSPSPCRAACRSAPTRSVRPRTGRLVMFPAWLLHQVRPYRGGAERISIAFNLSL